MSTPATTKHKNNEEFLGTLVRVDDKDSKEDDDDNTSTVFPVEANRYVLYVTAGCPFAARPWAVQALYGLPIRMVRLFPAADVDGWFFTAQSDVEKDLVSSFPQADTEHCDPIAHVKLPKDQTIHHLKQLYHLANPDFVGVVSVPLLWDTVRDTAVNNDSLHLARQLASTEFRHLRTRNHHVELFPTEPPELVQEHDELLQHITSTVTTVVYKVNRTHQDGALRDSIIDEFYANLSQLQERIVANAPHYNLLPGPQLRMADLLLFITLIRFDVAYQWRFGFGKYSMRDAKYRGLWQHNVQRLYAIPGLSTAIFPRDIMAMYFMGTKWNVKGQGRNVPQVPHAWNMALTDNPETKTDETDKDDDDDNTRPTKQARVEE